MQRVMIYTFLRMAFGAMWIVSAVLKLINLDQFVIDVKNYKFPYFDTAPGDMLMGYGLPWLELIVGVLMVIGIWKRPSYLMTVLMFGVFSIAVGYAKYHGLQIHCGCFGAGTGGISIWHLVALVLGGRPRCLFIASRRQGH